MGPNPESRFKDLEALLDTVEAMRGHQKAWFKEKRPSSLQNSKAFERNVDEKIKRLRDIEGRLF